MAQSFGKSAAAPSGTIIGPGLVVEGEISGENGVTVTGTVKGRLAVSGPVSVEQGGVVEADVEATEVRVDGILTGNVVASERVELSENARVVGDVRSPRIRIADGAGFKGHIDMEQ